MQRQNVELWTIEATLPGEQPFISPSRRVIHVELPEYDGLWQKERLLNVLLNQLPKRVTKVAWVDCDLLFKNANWPAMAVEALETWKVIQLFDHVHYLGQDDKKVKWTQSSSIESIASVAMHNPSAVHDLRFAAPGFAWAARRSLIAKHGFYDTNIDGSNDTIMALSMLGQFNSYMFGQGSAAMYESALEYGQKVFRDIRGHIGYIPVNVHHIWHGDFANRQYLEKNQRLRKFKFDPRIDLVSDPDSGLLRWSPTAKPVLKTYMRKAFALRKEDG